MDICAALYNDHVALSVGQGQNDFDAPDEMITPFAEAMCNLAVRLLRVGCCLGYSTFKPGEYVETYCDNFGYGLAPPRYDQVESKLGRALQVLAMSAVVAAHAQFGEATTWVKGAHDAAVAQAVYDAINGAHAWWVSAA